MPITPLEQAEQWMRNGKEVAIATLIKVSALSAIPVGSQLVINEDGGTAGSIPILGVESLIIQQAESVLGNGEPRIFEFEDLNDTSQHEHSGGEDGAKIYLERVG